MAAVAALLLCSLARAATAPGAGLKKADMKNCLNECSKHGKCMLNTAKRVEYGGRKVNPHMCTCDAGWVGVDCSLQVDMYLKWFTSKGDAPFPRCCSACAKQYTPPDDYFPHKLNPFGTQRCALLRRALHDGVSQPASQLVFGRTEEVSCEALGTLFLETAAEHTLGSFNFHHNGKLVPPPLATRSSSTATAFQSLLEESTVSNPFDGSEFLIRSFRGAAASVDVTSPRLRSTHRRGVFGKFAGGLLAGLFKPPPPPCCVVCGFDAMNRINRTLPEMRRLRQENGHLLRRRRTFRRDSEAEERFRLQYDCCTVCPVMPDTPATVLLQVQSRIARHVHSDEELDRGPPRGRLELLGYRRAKCCDMCASQFWLNTRVVAPDDPFK